MPLLIYKASAGSGKTFTLVKAYLKIVIADPFDYRHILAITFTNKATTEMKERILSELYKLTFPDEQENPMLEQLQKELPAEYTTDVIREQGKKVLDLILKNYSRFEISTIDSLFTRILRSFSKELNLPMSYQVDLDQEKAITRAVEGLYQQLDKDELLRKWFQIYAKSSISDEKGWNFDKEIKKLGHNLFDDRFSELSFGEDIELENLELLSKKLQTGQKIYQDQMFKFREELLEIMKEKHFVVGDFKIHTLNFLLNHIQNRDYDKKKKTFDAIAETRTGLFTKEKSTPGNEEAAQDIYDLIERAYKFQQDTHPIYLVFTALLKHIHSFGVLEYLSDKLKEYRDDENLLLLADHQSILRQNISETDAPFILEKIGSQFKHILLDEFQDTSDFQWKNLLPLVKNALSEDNTVLIVGDVKQSIYRWRGGNLELLHSQVRKELSNFYQEKNNITLKKNYRSSQEVIEFNNAFFSNAVSFISDKEDFKDWHLLEDAYSTVAQEIPKANGRGYVEIEFLQKKTKGPDDEKSNVLVPRKVVEKIKECIEHEFTYRDILILVDTNKEATELSQKFIQEGIPHVTKSSLLLKNSRKIKILILLLRYLQESAEIIHLAELMMLIKKSESLLSDDSLWLKHQGDRESILQSVESLLPTSISEKKLHLKQLSLPELLQELINRFQPHLSSDDFTNALIDNAVSIQANGLSTIPAFLYWWKENLHKLQGKASSGANAVQIMTVHRAKGLESPVVIYAYLQRKLNPKNDIIWLEDEVIEGESYPVLPIEYNYKLMNGLKEEDIRHHYRFSVIDRFNTIYVAFTRAEDRLYVICNEPSKKPTPGNLSPANIIEKALNMWKLPHSQNEKPDPLVHSFGKKLPKEIKIEHEATTGQEIDQNNTAAHSNSPSQLLSLTYNKDSYFKLLAEQKAYKIEIGIKAHAALERIEDPKELKAIIQQMKAEFLLDHEDGEKVEEKITDLFKQDKFAQWFDPSWEVLAERSILNQGKEYKPDRVVVKNNQAIIIDYKREKEAAKYESQLRKYKRALAMMGYQKIRMYLVFVETGEIIEVSDSSRSQQLTLPLD